MTSLSKKIDEVLEQINCESESEASNLKFPCGICKNSVKHNKNQFSVTSAITGFI